MAKPKDSLDNEEYLYAFDLSMNCTGLAIFEIFSCKPIYIASYKMRSDITHGEKLRTLEIEILKLMKVYPPSEVAIEQGFTKGNVATQAIFKVHGVVECRFWQYPMYHYTPSRWRKIVVGVGNAQKEVVKEKLENTLKINIRDTDESDAVGVGIAHLIIEHGYNFKCADSDEAKQIKEKLQDRKEEEQKRFKFTKEYVERREVKKKKFTFINPTKPTKRKKSRNQ